MSTQLLCHCHRLAKAWRAALAIAVALLMTGCASLQSPTSAVPAIDPSTAPPGLLACGDWYTALDAATDSAGVRDAGATRVAGFAHLRVDRFTASLAESVGNEFQNGTATAAQQAALVQRLLALDLQARAAEIGNLPAQARTQLANTNISTDILQRTQACGEQLSAYDTSLPPRMTALLQRLKVPDDYITGYRVAGAYAISQIPFAAGIRKMEAERMAVFAKDSPPAQGTTRVRFTPAASAASATASLSAEQVRRAIAPADPLRVPSPSPADLAQLFAQFAPSFDIDVATDDDKPGTLVWATPETATQPPTLTLDTSAPALYQHVSHTRYDSHNLLQLVYTLWFPARPKAPGSSFDLLAGKLDGIVWRVTLAPDGTPLVYDTIHPCGCYHMFFPTSGVQPKPAPQSGIEWAFIPLTLPQVTAQDRIVIRVAARTHYIDRVSIEPAATVGNVSPTATLAPYDYHSLRALPLPGSALASTANSRSVFSPKGFIDGTDRGERFLFWPMGIARAGTMRQWGKHATAFVGRRHFDDASLMQERFTVDTQRWGTLSK
jgi:type IV pilus biogenesis protein CpaD/CtpE